MSKNAMRAPQVAMLWCMLTTELSYASPDYTIIPELSTITTTVSTLVNASAPHSGIGCATNLGLAQCQFTNDEPWVIFEYDPNSMQWQNQIRVGVLWTSTVSGSSGNTPVTCNFYRQSSIQAIYICPSLNFPPGGARAYEYHYLYQGDEGQLTRTMPVPTTVSDQQALVASKRLAITTTESSPITMRTEIHGKSYASAMNLRATTKRDIATTLKVANNVARTVELSSCVVGKVCSTSIPIEVATNVINNEVMIAAEFVSMPSGSSGTINNDVTHASPTMTTNQRGIASYTLNIKVLSTQPGTKTYNVVITTTLA